MILFLLTAMPLFAAFLVLLPWNEERTPRRLFLGLQFLRGALLYFPAWLVLLLLRRIAGFAYSGFPLFLSLLVHTHLVPALLALCAFFLVVRRQKYPPTDEGVFLTVAAFLSGFFWMLGMADFVAEYGRWDAHVLFLLPAMRLALVLFLATIARHYERWEGRDGLLYCLAAAGTVVPAAMASFLEQLGRGLFAFLIGVILVAASLLFAAARYPQALHAPRRVSPGR